MEAQIRRIRYNVLTVLFIIFEIIFLFIYGWQDKKSYKDMLSHGLIFALMFILFLIILYNNEQKLLNGKTKLIWLYIGIMASVGLAVMAGLWPLYHLWIAGCMLIAMKYSIYLGISGLIMVLCIDGICKSYSTEQFVYYGVLGIVLCLLFDFLPVRKEKSKQFTSWLCFIIIGLSCNVSLYLAANGLNYTLLGEREFLITIAYTAVMITVVYLLSLFGRPGNGNEFVTNCPEDVVSDEEPAADDAYVKDETVSSALHVILSSEYELYRRMKEEKPQILKHSTVVADISKKAAKEIGADALLATAGGLYHEAGKLLDGEDYVSNNKKLAREYGFMDELTNILTSHNLKNDVPHSKEAAIVHFTDSIINTIYYIKNVKNDTSRKNEQIIDNIFEKRINNEKLYDCGLTLKEYGILKNFYIKFFEERTK